jgi:RNA polymerase sigma-70 factor (ECF subfamily)
MMIQEQDVKLFQLIKEGNEPAYAEIYNNYRRDVFVAAFRILRNIPDAEDITQEVFITLWNKRKDIVVNTALRGYLTRMAQNCCMNKIKHDTNLTKRNQQYSAMHADAQSGEKPDSEQLDDINRLMQELPDKSRRTMEMVYIEGRPHKEVAKIEGISVNTVKTQLYSSLKILRSKLQLK